MPLLDFINDYIFANYHFYIYVALVSGCIFYIVYRKFICVNKLELLYNWEWVISEIFCISNVFLLYHKKQCNSQIFFNYLISLIVFYFFVIIFQKLLNLKVKYIKRQQYVCRKNRNHLIYTDLFFLIYVIFTLLNLFVNGIGGFNNGNGSGAYIHLVAIISIFFNYSLVYSLMKEKKWRHYIYLLYYIFISFTGHSKSSILNFFLLFLLFYILNPSNQKVKKLIYRYGILAIILSIIFGILLIMLMSGGSFFMAISTLAYRFIAYGDVYIYAFPDNYILDLYNETNFLSFMFVPFFCFWRLLPYKYSERMNLPGALIKHVYGGGRGGPNPKFNVLGIMLFGLSGNIYFAIFVSFVFALTHVFFVNSINASYKKQLFAVCIFSSLSDIEQDASLIQTFISRAPFYLFIIIVFEMLEYACSRSSK